jgi:hypothetical protein
LEKRPVRKIPGSSPGQRNGAILLEYLILTLHRDIWDILAISTSGDDEERCFLITPQSYTQSLSKSEKIVSDNVRAYIKEPSEENVHDLRTSIRRLLTTANVLPKKIRRQKGVQETSRKLCEAAQAQREGSRRGHYSLKASTPRGRPKLLKTRKTAQADQRIISQRSKTIRIIHQG